MDDRELAYYHQWGSRMGIFNEDDPQYVEPDFEADGDDLDEDDDGCEFCGGSDWLDCECSDDEADDNHEDKP